MAGSQANDSMIRRLEKELEERNAAAWASSRPRRTPSAI